MKKKEIAPALEALKKVKIMQIGDNKLRNSVISVHIRLLCEQRNYSTAVEDARKAFLSSYGDEEQEVMLLDSKLRGETDRSKQNAIANEIASHAEYLNAVKEFNKRVGAMGDEDVDAQLPAEEFMKFMEQDYDCGVVEALFPLLKY